MTNNQVQYWSLRESARHNREMEQQGQQSIDELKRHNQSTEAQGWTSLNLTERQLGETTRHNLITESQGQQSINESIRHNVQSEQIGFGQIRATIEAAGVSAAATRYAAATNAAAVMRGQDINQQTAIRQQDINAFISGIQLSIDSKNAETNALNAQTRERQQTMNETDQPSRQLGMILGGVGSGVQAIQGAQNIGATAFPVE